MSCTLAMGQADANGFVTIGTGSSNKLLPIFPFTPYTYSQVIYLQSEINEAGEITKLHYYYSGEGDSQNSKDWVIYMGHTPKTEFATVDDWVAIGDLTQVYDGEVILINTEGWIEIPLSTTFTYNNTDNLVVAVDENTPGQGNGSQTFYSTSVTENRGLRQIGYDVNNIDPAAPGSGILVDGFANIKLLIPVDYAFTVNASTSESAIIGTSTQYSVTIDNIGLLSDTFTPTITGDGAWTYALYEADGTTELTGGITIAPGTFAEFIVQLIVPADATMGDTDTQNFTITAAGGSQTTETFSITTTAKVVLTVPYFEGFEDCVNNQPVALWGQASVSGFSSWSANSSNTSNNRAPRTGDFNACLYTNTQRWLLTPSYFELSASKTYKFSVYARQDGINADNVSITLMYGASATVEGMTEVAQVQTNIVGDEYQRIEGIFSPSADGNFYLGVLGKISYDGFSNWLSIDDISVEEIEFSVTSPLGVTVDAGMSHDYHVTIINVGQNSDNFTPSIVDGTWTYGLYELDGTTALTGAKTIASGASYEFIARVDVPITANFNDTDNAHLTVTSASGTQVPTTISITTTAFAALPLPFSEGFENCNDNAPVALWGQASVSGGGSWKANSSSGSNRAPRTGDLNAYLDFNNSRWLFSPSNFELEASKTYRFSVYARQDGEIAANASITLMYGTTATVAGMTGVIKELTGVVNGDYQLIEGTFSPTADGNFYVGILGEIDWDGGNSYYLSIDDISLVETFDNDAALTNISSPADIVEFNAAHDFIVTLKNNGENNLTALDINWSIGNPVVESGVYNWTGMLSRMESEEVTLTNYNFATPGDIAISATIDWAADMVGNNNTIEKSIYVEAQKCGYTIDLVDSYGDGWNGAVIGFKQNGIIVGTFGDAFTTGSIFGPISVDLEEDIETQIVVVNHNYAVAQIGFTVTDPFGYMVFHRATGDWFESDQIFHTFTSSCVAPTPHTVTLTIVDTDGPIADATFTFNGIEHTTGADGIVAIADVIDGTYAYSVTKYGYVSAEGNMIVAGADVTETITLDHVTYSVTFTMVDVSSTPIEGATLTFDEVEHTTNTEGIVVVTGIIAGSYSYTASKAGYTIETGTMYVNGPGITLTITLDPAYNVAITIVDGTTPIEGAIVSFYGIEQTTGSDGIVTFIDIPNGTNNYSVTKTGYNVANGQIVVDGADVEETITLTPTTYMVTLTVLNGNGSPIQDATLTFNGIEYQTPTSGIVNITGIINGTYNYTVTMTGFVDAIGQIIVDGGNLSETITLNPLSYNVTLTVMDGTTPIEGAIVTFDGVEHTTGVDGIVAITDVANGNYDYIVAKTGYAVVSDNINVNGADVSENITLIPLTYYNVTITVVDSELAPIEGATVTFDGVEHTTGADGIVALVDVANGTYNYTVSKTGYVDVVDNMNVNGADVSETISLSLVGVGFDPLNNLEVYPNPFNSEIIIANADWVNRAVITNIVGQRVIDVALSGAATINTSRLSVGIYHVMFTGVNGERVVRKVIKK